MSTADMSGLVLMNFSWKLDISSTAKSSAFPESTSSTSGLPMFPPTMTAPLPRRLQASSSIRPTSVVVVVFPELPVMPITGHSASSMVSSIS